MMSERKKSVWDNRWWILFLGAFVLIAMVLVNQRGNVGYQDQLLFLITQIAFVLIPGMALLLLFRFSGGTAAFAVLAYGAGIGIALAVYFICYALGLKDYLTLLMTAVLGGSVFVLWRRRTALKKIEVDNRGAWAASVLGAAVVLAVIYTAVSVYNTPDVSGGTTYIYQDLVWNAGSVTAAENGLPVMDIHIKDFTFGYHFLANVFLAVFKNMLGMSSYLLFCRMLPVVAAVVYAGAMYLLFSRLFKSKWAAAGAAGAAVLVSTTALQHMLWYAYATPLGLGFAMLAAYCFMRFMDRIETARATDGNFLLFLVFLALASGTKAPFAGGVLAGAGIVLLIQLLRKKNVKTVLIAGVAALAVFAAVYVSLVYQTYAFNGLTPAFASIMWAVDPAPAYYTAAVAAFSGTLPMVVIKLMTYPLFMILNFPTVVAAVVLLIVSLARHKKQQTLLKAFLLGAIIVGFLLTSVTYQPGMSNQFFLDGVVPLSVFALFLTLTEGWRKTAGKAAVCCIAVAAMALAAFFAVSGLFSAAQWIGAREGENAGATLPYGAITQEEYEGMLWLRENTPEDAVFASDRQYFTGVEDVYNARYYYYTAFSERQCYLEGYNYVSTHEPAFETVIEERVAVLRGVYANEAGAIEALREAGVDYLAVSSLLHPDFVPDGETAQLVFENSGIEIYCLNG